MPNITKLTNTNAAAVKALSDDNKIGYFDEIPDLLAAFSKDVAGCRSTKDVTAMLEVAREELGKQAFFDGSTPESAAKRDLLWSRLTLGTGQGPFSEVNRTLAGDLMKGLQSVAQRRIDELNPPVVDAFIYSTN